MTQPEKHITLPEALARIETEEDAKAFLVDLCTPAELRALGERWHVAQILEAGELSYREINAQTGVSTTTIGRVARFLREEPHGGYRVILDGLKDTS
jgi:TrpR-related protein YerC/YecD